MGRGGVGAAYWMTRVAEARTVARVAAMAPHRSFDPRPSTAARRPPGACSPRDMASPLQALDAARRGGRRKQSALNDGNAPAAEARHPMGRAVPDRGPDRTAPEAGEPRAAAPRAPGEIDAVDAAAV